MAVKVSQQVAEVAFLPTTPIKVSQIVAEVALVRSYSTPGALTGACFSQIVAEVALAPDTPVKVSQVVAEVAYRDADAIPYIVSHPVWIE